MGLRAPALALLIVVPLALAACGDKKAASTGANTDVSTTGATTTSPPPPPVAVTPPPAGSDGAKAVAAYKAYLRKQAAILVAQTTVFTTALRKGDPETAVKTYPKARAAYERLQRVAARLGLDTAMDAQEGSVPAAEWTGFQRIEKTIFDTGMTGGTEKPGATLLTDATAVHDAVAKLQLDPALILADARDLLARVKDTTSSSSEDPYSMANLYAMSGNIRSAEAAWKALRPLVAADDPGLATEIDNAIATAVTTLESFRTSHGFRTYDELGDNEKIVITNAVDVASEKLAAVQLP